MTYHPLLVKDFSLLFALSSVWFDYFTYILTIFRLFTQLVTLCIFIDGSLLEPEIALSPPKKVVKHEDVENKLPPSFDRLWASQPAPKTLTKTNQNSQNSNERVESGNEFGGFTQPAQLSDLCCNASQSNTQATQSNRFQRLVKRMTRFWVKVSFEETDKFLHGLLEKMHYAFKCKSKGIVSAFLPL